MFTKPFHLAKDAFIKSPVIVFVLLLIVFFGVIALGNILRAPQEMQENAHTITKKVSTLGEKDVVYVDVSGRVEKEGVITISSGVSGIVYRIPIETGARINRGALLVQLADNYNGATSASVQHEIAQRSVQNQNETFEKRYDIADDLKDDINKTDSLESSIARKQYSIQKRDLEYQRDLAYLQEKQAATTLGFYRPTSPFLGVVEHIFVAPGERVSPGMPLVRIRSSESTDTKVTAWVSGDSIRSLDIDTHAQIIDRNGNSIEVLPTYISSEPTDKQLFAVTFIIDGDVELDNDSFVDMRIPLASNGESGSALIPLSAVELTNSGAVVFVAEDGFAKAHPVEIGKVVGSYVYILQDDSFQQEDIILDRTVLDGDRIEIIAQ